MSDGETLRVSRYSWLEPQNGGLFVSAGHGAHATRKLESFELIFVRSGELRLFEEGTLFSVHRDQTLLLRPGRMHGGVGDFPKDLQFYWVHFRYAQARGRRCESCRIAEPVEVPRLATLESPERLADLFRRFIDDQETEVLARREATLLLLLMLCEVSRAATATRARSEPALVGAVMQHIGAHYNEPISTASIAAHFRYNADYLGRAFREATGGSITDTINRRRIKEARALLAGEAIRITEVAAACGFQDPGYFRKVFRALSGMTPRQYRGLYSHHHINTH